MTLIDTVNQHSKNLTPHLCSVTLLGNLVATPDIRYRANPAIAVTEIIVATSSKWFDKNTNKYKEWTSYHHIKVEGGLVELALQQATKGDIILLHGHLSNIKTTENNQNAQTLGIIHANFVQRFDKGYTKSINQIHCSARLNSKPKLMRTEKNKHMAQADIIISQYQYNIEKQIWQTILTERTVHIWGKEALYLTERGEIDDGLMLEGKLSYTSDINKTQFIEVKNVHLFKSI